MGKKRGNGMYGIQREEEVCLRKGVRGGRE